MPPEWNEVPRNASQPERTLQDYSNAELAIIEGARYEHRTTEHELHILIDRRVKTGETGNILVKCSRKCSIFAEDTVAKATPF